MSAAPTPLQLDANRANAQHSTGPKTAEGKAASSRNAQRHGLTTRDAFLPGEDLEQYQTHHRLYVEEYRPANQLGRAYVAELADLRWRLQRIPAVESALLATEMRALTTQADLAPLVESLESESEIMALAYRRLIEARVLTNLHHQEARLNRRAEKLEAHLAFVLNRNQELEVARKLRDDRRASEPITAPVNQKNEPDVPAKPQLIRVAKPGRNETCPCGSGVKSKRCCYR